ncbi:MAG: hypothetical protein U0414_33380 [Polyangiaceae bacterium]
MKKRVWASVAVGLVGAVLFAGCGDKSGGGAGSGSANAASGGKVASCNGAKYFNCKEYGPKNVEAAGIDMLKKLCTPEMGEFKEAPCPTEKVVGACSTPEGKSVSYEGGITAAEAEKQCKSTGGTFSSK